MSTQAKQQQKDTISGFEPYVSKAGEEYMGAPMRAHFTKILNKWKLDLMQEVDRTVDHMKDEAANFPDPPTVPARKKSSPSNCAPAIASAS